MKQIIVVIKDKLTGCGNLMSFPNAESAVRSFKEVIEGDNQIAKHAKDHDLIAIRHYDSEKGIIEAIAEPRELAKGEFLKKEKNFNDLQLIGSTTTTHHNNLS